MRILVCLAAAISVLASAPAAAQEKLYKWVDEDGNVTYQDRPPPGETGEVETFAGQAPSSGAAFPDVDIVLYSIKACDACDLVRNVLKQRGIPFEEKVAEGDAEVQTELTEVAGVLSVPVLTIGDEVIKGYNRDLILNELDEAGFVADIETGTPQSESAQPSSLTREDLEGMTPQEVEEAARGAASRGEDNDLFEEDEGFATLNEDIFSDSGDDAPESDDITQLEEIPEDERIRVGE